MNLKLLAWFYWDPPREAFIIPFFNHPVVWYGILFVIGFILAYFIFNPIFARFLGQSTYISSIDIIDWPRLIEILRTSPSPLISQLITQFDPSIQQQLKQKIAPLCSPYFQEGLLKGFNRLLRQASITRNDLQKIFGKTMASPKQIAYFLADRLCWFVIPGTIIGARLGAVFFYDWPYFSMHPLEIFKVWHGGLASHGGFIGIIISLFLYFKYIQQWVPQLTFLRLLDYITIPATLVCGFIRLGNFMNQEILGIPSTLPWAVLFGHPADGSTTVPRHPVQLYEAAAYFMIFCILWRIWKSQKLEQYSGAILGLAFILGFGGRFVLEFWKSTLNSIFDISFLHVGQILSIPFILLGIFLVWRSNNKKTALVQNKQ